MKTPVNASKVRANLEKNAYSDRMAKKLAKLERNAEQVWADDGGSIMPVRPVSKEKMLKIYQRIKDKRKSG